MKIGAGRLTEAAGIENTLRQAGTSGVALIGQVAYFLIFVIFVQIAAEVLQIDELTSMLNRLIAYLPLVAVALLVLFVAAAIANWAANVVRPFAESRNMAWVSTAVRVGMLVVGILAAFDTLNFAPSVTSKVQAEHAAAVPAARDPGRRHHRVRRGAASTSPASGGPSCRRPTSRRRSAGRPHRPTRRPPPHPPSRRAASRSSATRSRHPRSRVRVSDPRSSLTPHPAARFTPFAGRVRSRQLPPCRRLRHSAGQDLVALDDDGDRGQRLLGRAGRDRAVGHVVLISRGRCR